MAHYNPPPIAKIYEALGALADGRISFPSPTSARVVSSSGDKTYKLAWDAGLSWISSDDNASKWQGYMGYPVIMVLLLKKPIAYDMAVADSLKAVPWKELNTRYKNDYSKTIEEVLNQTKEPKKISCECERILEELKNISLGKGPQKTTQGELF